MTKVLIIGGGGMVGQKLAKALAAGATLKAGAISEMILHDIVEPAPVDANFKVTRITGNIADEGEGMRLARLEADVIFLLASIVSGEAETDFDKGYAVNLNGTWRLLEAIRAVYGSRMPKLVFTSSIAVFGAPFPETVGDEFFTTPLTSYGTQKAMSELLISDYSRKGFVDGIAIRLPTICVRPGKANLAASSFFSGIIREPLNGKVAILPVPESVRHWHASPRSSARFLVHAANLDTALLGNRRALTMPGLSRTVGEQIEALRQIAGNDVVKLIRHEPDARIMAIVQNWPRTFETGRASALGFVAETDFHEIIRIYMEEDLGRS